MVHIEMEPLEFMGAMFEENLAALHWAELLGVEGVAQIALDHLDMAQAEIDRLIAEDDTWRPA